MAIYAISDLHGQYDIFETLLERIHFSAGDYMFVLGDAIDRGPDGIKILKRIMDAPNMDLLIGNHEFMMLYSVAGDGCADSVPGIDANLWLNYNGGIQTFLQYKELSEGERKDLLTWLKSRLLSKLVCLPGGTFCLTHTYFSEECIGRKFEDLSYMTAWDIVWKTPYRSDLFVSNTEYANTGYKFIIGHVPVQKVVGPGRPLHAYHDQNILLIDGGCSFRQDRVLKDDEYGLICIRLDDLQEFVVTFKESG